MGNYITLSLELNLFFLRIMKEHSLFLESGFLVKEESLIQRSQWFNQQFEQLLAEVTKVSNGAVGKSVQRQRRSVPASHACRGKAN